MLAGVLDLVLNARVWLGHRYVSGARIYYIFNLTKLSKNFCSVTIEQLFLVLDVIIEWFT